MKSIIKKLAGVVALGTLVLGLAGLSSKVYADPGVMGVSTTAIVDVMVSPIVTVDLTASPTYYNFSYVSINTSSNSASAVNLQNTGNVGVTMQKHGQATTVSGNWSMSSVAATNQFVLHVATASDRPSVADFAITDQKINAATLNNLKGIGGSSQVSLVPTENVSLWFRIDMPTATTVGAAQTVPIHFVGTAQ